MQKENPLDKAVSLISHRKLYAGILEIENYLLSYPYMAGMDKLSAIKVDYELMENYWKRGANDPEREKVYQQLLQRLYVLAMNIRMAHIYRENNFWMSKYQLPRKNRKGWGLSEIRDEMESYVSDMAMLELEPEHVRPNKSLTLNRQHQDFMYGLFEYVLTSHQWRDSVAEQFVDMLLSPTIDPSDQQLLISAITLSAINAFDANKVLVLLNVYRKSADERVRQRALVGWALAIDDSKTEIYPELLSAVSKLLTNEQVCQELTELQMQLFYCKNAENDQRKIRDEIMPDIMNNGRIKMTKRGLVEMDEDTLEDIIHPEAAERDMEKMEQSVQRMADMQKQGSDIYFAGFSQMKRFYFFNFLSNWFVPFYPAHPEISVIWEKTKGKKFLQAITEIGAFCDSDKYSFILGFDQVLAHLPQQMLKMVEDGEASPMPLGGKVDEEEKSTPAYIRRMYLQDLYRFFHLYPKRQEFTSPFDERSRYLFFSNGLFSKTPLAKRMNEVVNFLIKRKCYADAEWMLLHYPSEQMDFQYYLLRGHLLQLKSERHPEEEKNLFEKALSMKPDDRKAMNGLARAYFYDGAYDHALEIYQKLLEVNPESKSYMLYASICMANLRQCDEALKLLYKLNYLDDTNEDVMLVLAWVLTIDGRFDEAKRYFTQLMSQEQPQADCFLYYGYCLWFSGEIAEAIKIFRRYLNSGNGNQENLEKAFFVTENDIIAKYHIGRSEAQMMLDALRD